MDIQLSILEELERNGNCMDYVTLLNIIDATPVTTDAILQIMIDNNLISGTLEAGSFVKMEPAGSALLLQLRADEQEEIQRHTSKTVAKEVNAHLSEEYQNYIQTPSQDPRPSSLETDRIGIIVLIVLGVLLIIGQIMSYIGSGWGILYTTGYVIGFNLVGIIGIVLLSCGLKAFKKRKTRKNEKDAYPVKKPKTNNNKRSLNFFIILLSIFSICLIAALILQISFIKEKDNYIKELEDSVSELEDTFSEYKANIKESISDYYMDEYGIVHKFDYEEGKYKSGFVQE